MAHMELSKGLSTDSCACGGPALGPIYSVIEQGRLEQDGGLSLTPRPSIHPSIHPSTHPLLIYGSQLLVASTGVA